MTKHTSELEELAEAFERECRIRIWNACKASNMKDDAAIRVVNQEIDRIKTDALRNQGDTNA